MTMRLSVAAAVALTLGLAGCRGGGGAYVPQAVEQITPASVPPGQETTLLPVAEGNQWVYAAQFQGQSQGQPVNQEDTITFAMRNVADDPAGGKRFTLEISSQAQPRNVQRQVWRVGRNGIFVLSQAAPNGTQAVFNPPQTVLPFPLGEDRAFNWSGRGPLPAGGASGQSRIRGRIVGVQEFDTDAKRMSGYLIETEQTWTLVQPAQGGQPAQNVPGVAANSIWFVPQVGIARYRQELAFGENVAVSVLRLKSHTVK